MAVSPGIKTTEFALVIIVNLASVAAMLANVIPPKWGLIIMAAISAVYSVLRAIIKINDPAYTPPPLPATTTSS